MVSPPPPQPTGHASTPSGEHGRAAGLHDTILRLLHILIAGLALLGAPGCAHTTAIGRGGPIFAVSVESIDGYPVVTGGRSSGYCYLLQVADRAVRVWPVVRSPRAVEADTFVPPEAGETLLEADAEALKSGILIERSWNQAVVHEVTDEELDVGAAMIFVPGERRSVVAELRFRRIGDPRPRATRGMRSPADGEPGDSASVAIREP